MQKSNDKGKSRSFLETPNYVDGIKARIPVLTVKGKKSGPMVVITAAQHGRELNGIASIERVFSELNSNDLSGTVVFLPVMNPLAVNSLKQDFPYESTRFRSTIPADKTMNMNRNWQTDPKLKSYGKEVCSIAWEIYLKHADLIIDLHGWSELSLSLAWTLEEHRDLLKSFGLPWFMTQKKGNYPANTLDGKAMEAEIPCITAELASQSSLNNQCVRFGENGILNVLRFKGMLNDREVLLPETQYEFSNKHVEKILTTPVHGLVVSDYEKGDFVKKGTVVCRVVSLETLETIWTAKSPFDGLLFNSGGTAWGEDLPPHSVVYPGQMVGILKKPTRIHKNSL
jgi:predicted deacylase